MSEYEAGRELDRAVARQVFGVPLIDSVCENLAWLDEPRRMTGRGKQAVDVPRYSTDIAAAWEVVEKLISLGWCIGVAQIDPPDGLWDVDVRTGDVGGTYGKDWFSMNAEAETAPLAICKAALQAVETAP